MTVVAVVLAGGSGSRVGADGNKVYLPLAGRRLVSWSLNAFVRAGIDRLVLVTRAEEVAVAAELVRREVSRPVEIIEGGASRHASESKAISYLAQGITDGTVTVIAVHDGARPLVSARLIRSVVAAATAYGGALPGIGVGDLAHVSDGRLSHGVRLAATVRVQTPQAFLAPPLLKAYRQAAEVGFAGSDTAACVEHFTTTPIMCLEGEVSNIKVTYPQDLFIAERLLADADYQLH